VPTTADDRFVAPFLYLRRPGSGQRRRGRSGRRHLWIPIVALASIVLPPSIASAPTKEVRRILILNEVGNSYPAINIINQGIETALHGSPYRLEIYSEYLDTQLFPDPAPQQEFRDFYLRKYQNRRPDVIITVGPSPLKFMLEVHRAAFPGVPIIFCLPVGLLPGTPVLDPDFTGIENDMAPAETLAIALRLQPGTKRVVVVGGVSEFDKRQQAAVKQRLAPLTNQVDISYMTDLAVPDLIERLRQLPNHTIVLLTSVGQDAAGTRYKSNEIGAIVAAAANAPVFSLFDVYLNHGEVGGDLASLSDQGRIAGIMALRTLNGEKPQNIPKVKGLTTYMFDWRTLKRWGLKESDLPAGSLVLHREATVWESYKWYFLGVIALILAEALLIFGLVWQRAKRRQVEAELATTLERLRLAVDAGKAVGWDWDLESGRDHWFGDLFTMFGIPSETYYGHIEDLRRRIYPDDQEFLWNAVNDARRKREQYVAEFRVVRDDRAVRWITVRGKFYYAANGEAERMVGMAVDITDRKQTEEKLQESEKKLAGVVASAMDAIIVVDEDQRIVLFNAAAERIFGCTVGEALETTVDRFIPQRLRGQHSGHIRHFGGTGVTNRVMGTLSGLWAVRATGEEFPIEASISQAVTDGKKLFTVIIRDVTERRRAEEAVRESEERFRLVANTAPVLLWMSGPDKLCHYFNQPWLEFTGRTIEAELGNGWTASVHAEDLDQCLEAYTSAFDRRDSFEMQFRLRRKDGEYRWVVDIGVPRFNPNNSFAGYIGSCIDVTERKRAEEALISLSGRLIDAQEEERKRIAREIHDDYNQRLAVLAVNLEELAEEIGDLSSDAGKRLHEIWDGIGELGADLHSLSHRLHSSTLESLGLVAGAKAFCEEFAHQQGIQVDFAHANVPARVPGNVALCLFRIVQEGLRNIKRHSGADRAEVRLEGSREKLHVSIADRGGGFDLNKRSQRDGIGIRSMEERLRSLGGHLVITSRPKEGTKIEAWVPLSTRNQNAA
jgi:PAS domain S-box-containing protein